MGSSQHLLGTLCHLAIASIATKITTWGMNDVDADFTLDQRTSDHMANQVLASAQVVMQQWGIRIRVPVKDFGALRVPQSFDFRGGRGSVELIRDTRGDFFRVTWTDAARQPKTVHNQTQAYVLSTELGQEFLHTTLMRNAGYETGMPTR
jgi:hypothetical protein